MINFSTYVNEKLKINKDFKVCDDFFYESSEEIANLIIETFGLIKIFEPDKTDNAIKETVKLLQKENIDKIHCRNIYFDAVEEDIKELPNEFQDSYNIMSSRFHYSDYGIKIRRYYVQNTKLLFGFINDDFLYKLFYISEYDNFKIICFVNNKNCTYICTIKTRP